MPGSLPSGPRYDWLPQRQVPAPTLIDLLAFAQRYRTLRPPADDIRKAFGVSEFTYQAQLNRTIDDPAAWAMAPELMERLKQRRQRTRVRRAGKI